MMARKTTTKRDVVEFLEERPEGPMALALRRAVILEKIRLYGQEAEGLRVDYQIAKAIERGFKDATARERVEQNMGRTIIALECLRTQLAELDPSTSAEGKGVSDDGQEPEEA